VVNFELPNVDEDYVHRIGRTGRAGRSGEAISLVAPDEEKLLKSIERMTKQKIADGDLMGFDSSAVEAEKPEVRERPDVRNPRTPPRGPKGDGPNGGGGGGGRRDKGKDKGGKEKAPANGRGERPAREQKPREGTPAREQRQPSQPPRAAADRAPDEFLDDDVDNFGNRVDYVPQAKPAQGRGRRPGAPAQGGAAGAGAGAPRTGQPQGRQNGPRSSNGATTGTPPAKRSGPRNGAPRDGQARREESRNRRPARDDQPREEPAVQNPRGPGPKIIHKESKSDRFPTPEQLDQLPGRPRGEKPALLTRNR